MDGWLRQRLGTYINEVEDAICGEWCAAGWPKCNDPRHAEGRALLEIVGAKAAKPDYGVSAAG